MADNLFSVSAQLESNVRDLKSSQKIYSNKTFNLVV